MSSEIPNPEVVIEAKNECSNQDSQNVKKKGRPKKYNSDEERKNAIKKQKHDWYVKHYVPKNKNKDTNIQ